MSTDAELLRRYAEEGSEAAFAELVRRHLDLVYFAALRQVGGDAHRAEEVAQSVFTDLARKARTLTGHATLIGWLHTGTRFAAAKARRADFSRQHHEREASTMNALLSDSDSAANWDRLRPTIDDAIQELGERDREAVLLRFFENRPFAEIGAVLRVSEDAARMRVERALDRLRTAFARRGVTSTGAALATILAHQAGAAAPVGLASAITSTALAGVAAGAAATGMGFLFMSKMTTTLLGGTVVLVASATALYQWTEARRTETELEVVRIERDRLHAQLEVEQARSRRSAQEAVALQAQVGALQAPVAASPVTATPAPSPAGGMPEELQRRGITATDLVIRLDEHMQIYLGPSIQERPIRKRLVSVQIHTESGNFTKGFDEGSILPMTREMLPKTAQAALSDADIDDINRHLTDVLPKWLPEQAPN